MVYETRHDRELYSMPTTYQLVNRLLKKYEHLNSEDRWNAVAGELREHELAADVIDLLTDDIA